MTIDFMDGFYYPEEDLHYKWDEVLGESNISIRTDLDTFPYAPPRVDANCLEFQSQSGKIKHFFINPTDEYVIGFRYRQDLFPSGGRLYPILLIGNADDDQVACYIAPDGAISFEVIAGIGQTVYTGTPASITNLVWQYIEISFKMASDATGYLKARVNEIEVDSHTNIITAKSGNAEATYYTFGGNITATVAIMDHYSTRNAGAVNTGYLGDSRVDIIRPNAAGDDTDFTPSAGANYENVDEGGWSGGWPGDPIGTDEDTTYNESDTVDDKDLYNLESITSTGATIFGIQQQSIIKKTDANNRYCKQVLKSAAVEDDSDEIYLNDSYTGYQRVFDQDPDGDITWTEAKVNAVQSGVKVST